MSYITEKYISERARKPVYLTSFFSEGRLLSVDRDLKVKIKSQSESVEGFSLPQRWIFVDVTHPNEDLDKSSKSKEFLIINPETDKMICHHLKDGGEISLENYQSLDSSSIQDCRWKIGKSGSVYQKHPEGGERYLWVANDELYVTTDGYLAENWEPLEIEGMSPLPREYTTENFTDDDETTNSYIFVLFLGFVLLAVYMFLRK